MKTISKWVDNCKSGKQWHYIFPVLCRVLSPVPLMSHVSSESLKLTKKVENPCRDNHYPLIFRIYQVS